MRDLSLHLLDIIQNSVSAKAEKISVTVGAYTETDVLEILITDNGLGMSEEFLTQVTSPFSTTRTTRKVGMGLPLLKSSAQRASGDLEIQSVEGKGTSVKAVFLISHVDRPPIGSLSETIVALIVSDSRIEYEWMFKNDKEDFRLNTMEIQEQLGEVPITHYEAITWVREYVDQGAKKIFGGVLDEINS